MLAGTGTIVDLTVAVTAFAGRPFADAPGAGQCVRIMTGTLMPPGCDTVVPQELITRDGDATRFGGAARAEPAPVRRRPGARQTCAARGPHRVGIRSRLAGVARYRGCRRVQTVDLGIVRDDRASLDDALRRATRAADVVISSGGVSVGDADFTRELMNTLGDVPFWKIAMRPGCPLAFGRIWSGPRAGTGESALFFGLPSNPVAVMAMFYFIVREALLTMSGATHKSTLRIRATCAGPIKKRAGRTEFQRGIAMRHDDGG